MEQKQAGPQTIDEYMAAFSPEKQEVMREMRRVIHEEAPEAGEKISWGMPTFTYYGNLVHFAAQTHHLGLYPGVEPIVAFAGELEGYKTSKGGIQFPFDQPVPYELVRKIVRYNMARNRKDAEEKAEKKAAKKAEKK